MFYMMMMQVCEYTSIKSYFSHTSHTFSAVLESFVLAAVFRAPNECTSPKSPSFSLLNHLKTSILFSTRDPLYKFYLYFTLMSNATNAI